MSLTEKGRELPHIAYLDIEEHFEKTDGNWAVPFKEEDRENFQDVVNLCDNAEEIHRTTEMMTDTSGGRSIFLLSRKYDDFDTVLRAFEGRSIDTKMEKISAAKRAFEVLAGKRTYAELEKGDIDAGRQLAGHLIFHFRMQYPGQP